MWTRKKKFTNRVMNYLKIHGFYIVQCKDDINCPDIVACAHGEFYAIKLVKKNDNIHISKCRDLGEVYRHNGRWTFAAADNFNNFKATVKYWLKELQKDSKSKSAEKWF